MAPSVSSRSRVASFPVILCALVILAAGSTTVQLVANAYVTIIGPPRTASSRLNLAQAFNSVGTFIAPFFGAMLILKGASRVSPAALHTMSETSRQLCRVTEAGSVCLSYIGMATALFLLAIGLA